MGSCGLTTGRLRALPTNYPASAPVRFVTEDGRSLEFVRAMRDPAPIDPLTEKYTGDPTLVIVVRDPSSGVQ